TRGPPAEQDQNCVSRELPALALVSISNLTADLRFGVPSPSLQHSQLRFGDCSGTDVEIARMRQLQITRLLWIPVMTVLGMTLGDGD
ncbi:hypothetical protein BaRGS_00003729, partial [Batillaria attramentaria]